MVAGVRSDHPEAGRWPLALALLYVAVGPAVLACRAFEAGVSRIGPQVAGCFINLTPLFTAFLSSAFPGEVPHIYNALAFILIQGGIAVSSSQR